MSIDASLKPLLPTIKHINVKYNVPERLILAIIWQESRGSIWAYRYEPKVGYLYSPTKYARKLRITEATEITSQKTSWGLMQVMGFKAREMGFESYLPQLLMPDMAVEYGVRILSELIKKYPNQQDVIASYNAGSPRMKNGKYSNQGYVDAVIQGLSDIDQLVR